MTERRFSDSEVAQIFERATSGQALQADATRLVVPPVPVGHVGPLWLIFRISGNTVELTAPLVPGGAPNRRDLPGGVRVYACGDHDLTGKLDARRGASLKRAYGIAC